jgi:hypothetical protein
MKCSTLDDQEKKGRADLDIALVACAQFFEKNQERGWITKQGQPIKRWKSLLWVWAEKEEKPKSAREDTFEQNDYDFEQLEQDLTRN